MATNKCVKLEEHMKLAKENKSHKEEVNALKFQVSDEALQQMPDFQGRVDVLKEIGCIDADLVVQIKGCVACEMNSGEELIRIECLFENQLDDLEPEEEVAVMSAFVFQQKTTSQPSVTPKLSMAKQRAFQDLLHAAPVVGYPYHFGTYLSLEIIQYSYKTWGASSPFRTTDKS